MLSQFILLFFNIICFILLMKFLPFPVTLCMLFFILVILMLWNFYSFFFFLSVFLILIFSYSLNSLNTNILLFSSKPKTLDTSTPEASSTKTPGTLSVNTLKKVSLSSKKYKLEKNKSNFFWIYYNKNSFMGIGISNLFGMSNKSLMNQTLVFYLIWILNGSYNVTGSYFVYDSADLSLSSFSFYTLNSFPKSIAVYKVSKVNYKVFLTVFTEGMHILDYSWGTYYLKYYKIYNCKTVNYLEVPSKNIMSKEPFEMSLSYSIDNAMISNFLYHKKNYMDTSLDSSISKSFLVSWCIWCSKFLSKKSQSSSVVSAKYKFWYDMTIESKLFKLGLFK